MATIKAYTDLQQSRKLAEILPIESADMRIGNYVGKSGEVDGTNVHYYTKGESFGAPEIIYAWSLAALIDFLPILDNRSPVISKTFYGKYIVTYHSTAYEKAILTSDYDNPIDACYELILKLNELNLL